MITPKLNKKKKNEDGTPSPKKDGSSNKPKFNFYWIYIPLIILFLIGYFMPKTDVKEKQWDPDIKQMVVRGEVDSFITVKNLEKVEVYLKKTQATQPAKKEDYRLFGNTAKSPDYYFDMPVNTFMDELDRLKASNKEITDFPTNKIVTRHDYLRDAIGWLMPIVLIVLIWVFIMRRLGGGAGGAGGQIFNIGKSRAQLFDKDTKVNVTFKDVAGLEEAKVEIMEIVDFLKTPKKYTELGGKIPKGALLVGPPGTGKTLLAKAVAGEANVPFFSLSGSDFVEMFVGVGASRVRDLFRQAKEKSPCIIFIDEIDAIGRARGKNLVQGANDERENTLNQLLTEMDGFSTNSGIIILAATNRADILDRALMRAGRFDRQIYVDMPDLNERKDIFKVHLKPLKLDPSVDVDFLARQTPGFSGADIANICNEAALIAARHNKKVIEKQDFLDAVDRIIGGLEKKNKIISVHEKKMIAYHEAGHASVSWLLEHAHPLIKVTIVPRGRSLGAAWYLPEERQITTTEQLLDEMCATLGGRAAEEIIFGKISTGALSDLEKVTKQAYAMVTIYGLNPRIGNISYYDSTGANENGFTKPYSEKTAEAIDEEVNKLIAEAYQRAKDILLKNKDLLTRLADKLLEKEVIFKEDLELIFGKRPYDKEETPLLKSDEINNISQATQSTGDVNQTGNSGAGKTDTTSSDTNNTGATS